MALAERRATEEEEEEEEGEVEEDEVEDENEDSLKWPLSSSPLSPPKQASCVASISPILGCCFDFGIR